MKLSSKYLVYVLSDPRTGEVRYVGKSCSGMARPKSHLCSSNLLGSNHRINWLKSLVALGMKPLIEVVEEFDSVGPLGEAECFWIAQFRAWGFSLVNGTDGGDGAPGRAVPSDVRERISRAQLGVHRPYLVGNQHGRGRRHTEEWKRLQRERMVGNQHGRGYRHTEEARQLIRAASIDRQSRPFRDQHGNLYQTQTEAARLLGVRRNHVSEVLAGRRRSVGGHAFTWVR